MSLEDFERLKQDCLHEKAIMEESQNKILQECMPKIERCELVSKCLKTEIGGNARDIADAVKQHKSNIIKMKLAYEKLWPEERETFKNLAVGVSTLYLHTKDKTDKQRKEWIQNMSRV